MISPEVQVAFNTAKGSLPVGAMSTWGLRTTA
jgi:hypothetical protein